MMTEKEYADAYFAGLIRGAELAGKPLSAANKAMVRAHMSGGHAVRAHERKTVTHAELVAKVKEHTPQKYHARIDEQAKNFHNPQKQYDTEFEPHQREMDNDSRYLLELHNSPRASEPKSMSYAGDESRRESEANEKFRAHQKTMKHYWG